MNNIHSLFKRADKGTKLRKQRYKDFLICYLILVSRGRWGFATGPLRPPPRCRSVSEGQHNTRRDTRHTGEFTGQHAGRRWQQFSGPTNIRKKRLSPLSYLLKLIPLKNKQVIFVQMMKLIG